MSEITAKADAMLSAIYAYFNAFTDGKLDSSITHAALVGIIAIAEVSLCFGIWLESPKNKTCREWLGLCLVFGGCIISVLATVGLLIFDEGISRTQQSKIIALETRIAQRELSSEEIPKFLAAIEAIPASVPHKVVFSYLTGDQESEYFAYEIGRYFIAAHWAVDVEVRTYPVMLTWGISIFGPDNATTRAVQGIFKAANIQFSDKELAGGFMSFGHQPSSEETIIFIGPKQPAISAAEAARAGAK